MEGFGVQGASCFILLPDTFLLMHKKDMELMKSKGGHKDARELKQLPYGLFIRDRSHKTRGDGFQLEQGGSTLAVRSNPSLWGC